jgi:hypothetical protein
MLTSRSPQEPGSSSTPFGITRPAFGLSKETGHRVEVVFAMKGGGTLGALHDLGGDLTEESFGRFVQELQEQVARGQGVASFADAWGSTGSRTWGDLSQVSGFSVRPAR